MHNEKRIYMLLSTKQWSSSLELFLNLISNILFTIIDLRFNYR